MKHSFTRILAVLAAAGMMGSLCAAAEGIALAAQPYWTQRITGQYEALPDGSAKNTMTAALSGFLAVTDGTELTDAQLAVLPDDYDWQIAEVDLTDVQWNGAVTPQIAGGRCYQVTIAPDFHVAPAPDMDFISRMFFYANDAVSAVTELSYEAEGTCEWTGEFIAYIACGACIAGCTADLSESYVNDEDYLAAVDAWMYSTMSDYDMIQMAIETADLLTEKYPDQVNVIVPDIAFTPETMTYSADSPEISLGDADGNALVDAQDAAGVLSFSSTLGAMSAEKKAEAMRNYYAQGLDVTVCDVNGDMEIDAEDAAWILSYAASAGSDTREKSLQCYFYEQSQTVQRLAVYAPMDAGFPSDESVEIFTDPDALHNHLMQWDHYMGINGYSGQGTGQTAADFVPLACEPYTEEFFRQHNVAAIHLREYASPTWHEVYAIDEHADGVSVSMIHHNGWGEPLEEQWIVLVQVDKTVTDADMVDVIITEET